MIEIKDGVVTMTVAEYEDMFNIVRGIGEKDCQQKIKNVLGVN